MSWFEKDWLSFDDRNNSFEFDDVNSVDNSFLFGTNKSVSALSETERKKESKSEKQNLLTLQKNKGDIEQDFEVNKSIHGHSNSDIEIKSNFKVKNGSGYIERSTDKLSEQPEIANFKVKTEKSSSEKTIPVKPAPHEKRKRSAITKTQCDNLNKLRGQLKTLQQEYSIKCSNYTKVKNEKAGILRSFMSERQKREYLRKEVRKLRSDLTKTVAENESLKKANNVETHSLLSTQIDARDERIYALEAQMEEFKLARDEANRKWQKEIANQDLMKEELEELKQRIAGNCKMVNMSVQTASMQQVVKEVSSQTVGLGQTEGLLETKTEILRSNDSSMSEKDINAATLATHDEPTILSNIVYADDWCGDEVKEPLKENQANTDLFVLVPSYELEMLRSQVEKQAYSLKALEKNHQDQRSKYEILCSESNQKELCIGSAKAENELLKVSLLDTQNKLAFKSKLLEETSLELGWVKRQAELAMHKSSSLENENILSRDELAKKKTEIDALHEEMKLRTDVVVKLEADSKTFKTRCEELEKWKSDIIVQVDGWRNLLYKIQVTQPEQKQHELRNRIASLEKENKDITIKFSKALQIIRQQIDGTKLLEKRIEMEKDIALAFVEKEERICVDTPKIIENSDENKLEINIESKT